jgi:hypothetical protein
MISFLVARAPKIRGMEHDNFETVHQCIRDAAQRAAAAGSAVAPPIERFLRSGERTWDGAGSGHFTTVQFKEDEAYTQATKVAMRILFRLLTDLLPAAARMAAGGSGNDSPPR